MSGYGNYYGDEDEDELDEQRPVEPPTTPPPPQSEDAERATRSKADDILDAVAGSRQHKGTKACPACNGTEFVRRGPTVGGGTITLMCRKCRLEIPLASVQSAVVPIQKEIVSAGPFYTSDGPKDPPDRNLPPHRVALERQK